MPLSPDEATRRLVSGAAWNEQAATVAAGNAMKHTPATPLPWNNCVLNWVQPGDDKTENSPQGFMKRDSAYALHACNAYPQIVAALRQYVDVVSNVNDPTSFAPQIKDEGHHARNLLRSLGEIE